MNEFKGNSNASKKKTEEPRKIDPVTQQVIVKKRK